MSPIKRNSNWASIDELDDIAIRNGELLIVQWPDGTLQQLAAIVESGHIDCGEQGGVYKGTLSHAFAAGVIRGIGVRIPLVGLPTQRVV